MKKRFLAALATGLFLVGMGGVAQALTLTIGTDVYSYVDGAPVIGNGLIAAGTTGPGVPAILADIESLLNIDIDLLELYKADNDSGYEGTSILAGSYDTVFSNTENDPQDATITYTGGDIVGGVPAYLLVKDGDATPVWYLFDLTSTPLGWDGKETLSLAGFWPNQDALGNPIQHSGEISHVSLYGTRAPVPEPGTVLLFGTGLAGLAAVGRRRKN